MFLEQQSAGAILTVHPRGRWLIENAAAIESELTSLDPASFRSVSVDADGLEEMDLTGAWILLKFLKEIQGDGSSVAWQGEAPDEIRLIEKTLADGAKPPVADDSASTDPVSSLGRWAVVLKESFAEGLEFFGRLATVLGGAFGSLRRLRLPSVTRQIYETGIQAIPIVSLIAFLISVIIAYMGAQQLRKFGAEIYVVDLVTVGVLRELSVLLTAIIVAGRSGSAFAAEIGVMKLNDEVDALRAMGTNPIEVLVLPRVLGLVIALPLLTIIGDIVGLAGGGLLSFYLLDMPPIQYLSRMQEAIAPTTFWVGLIKAPVFAFLIAFIGTLRGMQVRDSSRELGRLTTVAVVQSIFLVILADAVFAVIFMQLDI